jgi:hypothetical protein
VLDDKDKKKRAKTTGCLEAVNHALRKRNEKGIAASRDQKFVERYRDVSKPYRKRVSLLAHAPANPSLELFVDSLRRLDTDDVDPASE